MADIIKDIQNAQIHEMVNSVGLGIANAQQALDRVSMDLAEELVNTKVSLGENEYSLLALGFTPTFYQYTDTIIEMKIAFSMKSSNEQKKSGEVKAGVSIGIISVGASVSASYSQKYQYSAEGSSYLRTKLVTVPNPPAFEQRLSAMIETELAELRNNNPTPVVSG